MRSLAQWLFVAALIALTGFSVHVLAASRPAQIDSPRLMAGSFVPVYCDDDKLESLNVTAKFAVKYLQPDGKTKKTRVITVEFDLIEAGKQSVEVDGVLYDYDELGIGLVAACFKQYLAGHPMPLPVRRALREKSTPP